MTENWIQDIRSQAQHSEFIDVSETSDGYGDDYARDKSCIEACPPDLIVIPHDSGDVPIILRLATQYKVPVTVRGAGTGTTGGALAVKGGIILSLEKCNQILEFDIANKMVVVEPGVITGDIQTLVESKQLFYPPDPQSLETCSIGGNVAENAGGPRALKYGVTGQYVIGLAGYYMDGTPFRYGGKQIKNVAGYDMIHLLVGSEGTLAVITEITLKLRVLPEYRQNILVFFNDYDGALKALTALHTHHIEPSTAEFLDPFCFEAVAEYMQMDLPYDVKGAAILFELDGNHLGQIEKEKQAIATMCQKYGVSDIDFLETDEKRDFAWKMRRQFSLALTHVSQHKLSEDVVVPPNQIAAYLKTINDIGDRYHLKILGYGHLGDGNIHVNILELNSHATVKEEDKERAVYEVMKAAVDCGGTITGEHGIGLTKKQFMPLVFSEKDMAVMKLIKNAFDPEGLLNPKKLHLN